MIRSGIEAVTLAAATRTCGTLQHEYSTPAFAGVLSLRVISSRSNS
ncbi:MAG: hypothetical protein P8I74_07675 [Phycisphaerales bacterium]|nr:hypothetical protein [Phycisphaerales bacterium]